MHNIVCYFSDFDKTLKRPVSSRYGTGLFSTLFHPGEGKTFNVNIPYRKYRFQVLKQSYEISMTFMQTIIKLDHMWNLGLGDMKLTYNTCCEHIF